MPPVPRGEVAASVNHHDILAVTLHLGDNTGQIPTNTSYRGVILNADAVANTEGGKGAAPSVKVLLHQGVLFCRQFLTLLTVPQEVLVNVVEC